MKFSIRDVLWLTILVAVAVTQWLDHRADVRRQEQLRQQGEQLRYQAQLERAHRLLMEAEIVAERRALEAQARDHEENVKAVMERLAKPLP